jgi:hypothetical protein
MFFTTEERREDKEIGDGNILVTPPTHHANTTRILGHVPSFKM